MTIEVSSTVSAGVASGASSHPSARSHDSVEAAKEVGSALEAVILDVGHGNCAILRDGERCMVVDAPKGTTLFDVLEQSEIWEIEHLILSHMDEDHIKGATRLLWDARFRIGTIWYNPNGMQKSRTFEHLRKQVAESAAAGRVSARLEINSVNPKVIAVGRVRADVLHPDFEMASTGPTSYSSRFGKLTANTLSVALRISLDGANAVLLPADMDRIALDRILSLGVDLSAPVLVFPHHGGRPGDQHLAEFAEMMCAAVSPNVVIFSMERGGRYSNPAPEIVDGVRKAAPRAHIACTQFSTHCQWRNSTGPGRGVVSSSDRPAAGRQVGSCCAGTLAVIKTDSGVIFDPPLNRHLEFIKLHVADSLCKQGEVPSQRPSSN
ncbi:ComEC/Rec2 family competence protein [Streptomyces sp. PTD9-10]|uniref:ComEC/Rec2 family competence protein n=1 Tax=Streptomyces sp. PTD9-10 TaxID=3120151 RepID=UPI00300A7998